MIEIRPMVETDSGVHLALNIAAAALFAWALLDALRRPRREYEAAGTKRWLALTIIMMVTLLIDGVYMPLGPLVYLLVIWRKLELHGCRV